MTFRRCEPDAKLFRKDKRAVSCEPVAASDAVRPKVVHSAAVSWLRRSHRGGKLLRQREGGGVMDFGRGEDGGELLPNAERRRSRRSVAASARLIF